MTIFIATSRIFLIAFIIIIMCSSSMTWARLGGTDRQKHDCFHLHGDNNTENNSTTAFFGSNLDRFILCGLRGGSNHHHHHDIQKSDADSIISNNATESNDNNDNKCNSNSKTLDITFYNINSIAPLTKPGPSRGHANWGQLAPSVFVMRNQEPAVTIPESFGFPKSRNRNLLLSNPGDYLNPYAGCIRSRVLFTQFPTENIQDSWRIFDGSFGYIPQPHATFMMNQKDGLVASFICQQQQRCHVAHDISNFVPNTWYDIAFSWEQHNNQQQQQISLKLYVNSVQVNETIDKIADHHNHAWVGDQVDIAGSNDMSGNVFFQQGLQLYTSSDCCAAAAI